MDDPDLDPLNPLPCIYLLHLARGQPVRPAPLRPRWAAPVLGSRHGVAPSKGLQDGRLVPHIRLREERWEVSWSQTIFGVLHQDLGLLWRAFAHHQRDDQLAVGSDRRMVPHGAPLLGLVSLASLLLLFTKRHCSSNSSALGVRSCTC